MKGNAGVGVELSQIYLLGRRSHHPNDAPCHNLPNPNYHAKTEKTGSPSLLPPERLPEGGESSGSTAMRWPELRIPKVSFLYCRWGKVTLQGATVYYLEG